MIKITTVVCKCLLVICFITPVLAQDNPLVKISGTVFGDYYWAAQNHSNYVQGSNGFWLRRIFLTFDKELGESFSARLRFDMLSAGDFETKSTLDAYVKDAYVEWKSDYIQLILGISPTPTFLVVEKFWKYRSVEKCLEDLQKLATTKETGLAVKGKFDSEGIVKYHFMVGNGNAEKSESNNGKMMLLAFDFALSKNLALEVYGNWNDLPGSTDWYTMHGFLGYENESISLGVQYIHQIRKSEEAESLNINALSVFCSAPVSEKISLLGRVDRMFDPNPQGNSTSYLPFSNEANSTLLIAGVDYHPVKNLSLIPNIEVVLYDSNNGEKATADIMPRITFSYNF